MKSLHLVKTSHGATWAYRLMRDLVKMGDEVHVALPLDGPLIKLYQEAGVFVHELNYSLHNICDVSRQLRRIVNEFSPNIIHSHFVLTTLLMRIALRNKNIPRVFEVPGPLHLEHFLYRQLDLKLAQNKIDYWIPTCNWSYNKYKSCGVSETRLFLTYYGNDLISEEFQSGLLRKELGLNDNDIIVGMVAYMYAPKRYLGQTRGLKGHEDLIDAIALIQNKYPNLHLVMVGGAWNNAVKYEQRVIKYGIERCKHIHFLGTRNDVPNLYQDFDMVVHPSHSENLGGAAESLKLGIPTIATNIGGFPDIVKHKTTGLLVPVHSPKAIASAIEYFINHPTEAKATAQEGQKLVNHLMDASRTSKDVYNYYRKIAPQSGCMNLE